MSDVQSGDWEQPDLPVPRPDPIRPGPRNVKHSEMVALRDHLEMKIVNAEAQAILRIESLSKELAVALKASDVAIEKADRATEKRFESVNEFRQTLSDQTRDFMPRSAVDAMERNLLEKLDTMRQAHAAEIAALRSTFESKIDAQYKIIWTMAGAIAAIQATLAFLT